MPSMKTPTGLSKPRPSTSPMPRIVGTALRPELSVVKVRLGVKFAMSRMLRMSCFSRSAALNAVMATGTTWRFSETLREVTTISSRTAGRSCAPATLPKPKRIMPMRPKCLFIA
jgi:hypothetical protein